MNEQGYAVVDVETTGLSTDADRIIEIAVVLVSAAGQIEGRWETLVNPGRDTGPTHIHGIYGADVADAPTFDQVAARLLGLLRGRVFVAHNASFDTRFLRAELERAQYSSPLTPANTVCTMLLAKNFMTLNSRSLAACCVERGIILDDAHRASADAYATAQLLASYISSDPGADVWSNALEAAAGTVWPDVTASEVPLTTRETAAAKVSILGRVTGAGGLVNEAVTLAYPLLVQICLHTFDAKASDVDSLLTFIHELGLSAPQVAELNRDCFAVIVAEAWADGKLTDALQMHIVAAARLFGMTGAPLTAALRPPVTDSEPITLEPGSKITLTGFSAQDKRDLGTLIEAAGYVVWPTLIKASRLLVASDTDSLSSKGRTARRFGVPIVNEAGLRDVLVGLTAAAAA